MDETRPSFQARARSRSEVAHTVEVRSAELGVAGLRGATASLTVTSDQARNAGQAPSPSPPLPAREPQVDGLSARISRVAFTIQKMLHARAWMTEVFGARRHSRRAARCDSVHSDIVGPRLGNPPHRLRPSACFAPPGVSPRNRGRSVADDSQAGSKKIAPTCGRSIRHCRDGRRRVHPRIRRATAQGIRVAPESIDN
jgi:hypothetical protein